MSLIALLLLSFFLPISGSRALATSYGITFDTSHPSINMHTLHTVYYTFAKVLTRRTCFC